MNIAVCIKQVPATQKVDVDPVTGVLKRDGIETKMNPYDCYAIETALQIQKKTKAKIHVITMGPLSAKEVLQEGFALGAEEGWLLTDRKFGGADVLATAYSLACGIRQIGNVDIIICGKQTTDGDTAQVGPEMAEVLNIPHISWVQELIDADETGLVCRQDLIEVDAIVRLPYPCLITVEKGIFQPNLPSYSRKKASADYPIHVLSADQCEGLDQSRIGLSGSPTQVERIFTPTHDTKTLRLEKDERHNAAALVRLLKEEKIWEEGGMSWQE